MTAGNREQFETTHIGIGGDVCAVPCLPGEVAPRGVVQRRVEQLGKSLQHPIHCQSTSSGPNRKNGHSKCEAKQTAAATDV
eukprot:scaffold397505_cov31-Prasinocladus_malaysianus.AAC.1